MIGAGSIYDGAALNGEEVRTERCHMEQKSRLIVEEHRMGHSRISTKRYSTFAFRLSPEVGEASSIRGDVLLYIYILDYLCDKKKVKS